MEDISNKIQAEDNLVDVSQSESLIRVKEVQGDDSHIKDVETIFPSVETPMIRRNVPDYFEVSGAISIKYPAIEKQFFAIRERKGEHTYNRNTLSALVFAACEKLSDDSFQRRMEKHLTGRGIMDNGIPITLTMRELMENGFGLESESKRHRQSMHDLIVALNNTPIPTLQETKSKDEEAVEMLLNFKGGVRNKRNPNIYSEYHLSLNKVFTKIAIGCYGKHPKDIMKRLTKIAGKNITEMDRPLLLLLGRQSRKKDYPMKIENLIEYLGIYEEYANGKTRTLNKIIELFERMKKVGVIIGYSFDKNSNVIFSPNPYYATKEPQKALQEEENIDDDLRTII